MFLPVSALLLLATPDLSTIAETSHWQKTGRYEEVERLCHAFPKAFPKKVRCLRFGTTPERRPMWALVASLDGVLEPERIRLKKRPVLYLQGGIHAGEIDGKDAGFWLLRDLLSSNAPALRQVTVLFVPVFNVDGHERFGKNHRVNQRGPEETGWRVTAQNLNLNRDYAKAEAPEMEALLSLLNRFDPIVLADLHVTDGAKFEHDVAVMIEPSRAGSVHLRPHGLKLQEALFETLAQKGHTPLPFYPSFREEEKPESGFQYGIAPPRFSHSYWAHRNRLGILVETHSWRDFAHRVKTTFHVSRALVELTAQRGPQWLAAAEAADRDDVTTNEPVVLRWKNTDARQALAFLGYAFERQPSEVSGSSWLRYDETKPTPWHIPYWPEVTPDVAVSLPEGYLVPAAHAEWIQEKLHVHGFSSERLKTPGPSRPGETFRVEQAVFASAPSEGRMRFDPRGRWQVSEVPLTAGALWVSARQPGRALLLQLLEPSGVDSFLQWGFFNAHFEEKEYMEPYVAEEVARELLQNPEVMAAFQKRLATDEAFARSPRARLHFFYEKHPSYDEAYGVYPIQRVTAVDTARTEW